MIKQAISITLDIPNITWLKGRVGATGLRSLSELINCLVTAARQGGQAGTGRSVVGTIDIDASDPTLDRADAIVHDLFARSLAEPLVVRERAPRYAAKRTASKGRRG